MFLYDGAPIFFLQGKDVGQFLKIHSSRVVGNLKCRRRKHIMNRNVRAQNGVLDYQEDCLVLNIVHKVHFRKIF